MANIQLTQTGAQVQADLDLTEQLEEQFSSLSTYAVGAIVIYDSKIWRCHTAVTVAGEWTGSANWAQIHLSDLVGMSNPMTTSQDIIVGGADGAPSRLAKGNNGELLRVNSSGNLAYGNNLPVIDCTGVSPTYPSTSNTEGLIIVLCSAEPSTKVNGYLYIVLGS